LLIKWEHNAREIEAELLKKFPYLGASAEFVLHREYPHFRPGLTWPPRTQSGLGMRALPAGCVFGNKGPAAFIAGDNSQQLSALLAITTSEPFRGLVEIQMAFGSYEVGVIQRTVLPSKIDQSLADCAHTAWAAKRELDTANVTSHAFHVTTLARGTADLSVGIQEWGGLITRSADTVADAQRQIDDIAYELYDVHADDRVAIKQMLGSATLEAADAGDEDYDTDDEIQSAEPRILVSELFDYITGTTFGRWDIRHATGERQSPDLPDPFDLLPVCPPGMLQNAESLPAESKDVPANYPLRISWPGILVDDESHLEDIVARVREAIEVIWKNRAEAIEAEACEILEVKAKPKENLDALRVYFRDPNRFFKDHLARYSKSRRKAPIYWPLSTDSGSYTLWIYYHRLNRQTLFTCIEMIDLKREGLGREIESLRSRIGTGGSAEERQKLEDQAVFLAELKTLRGRLLEVTNLPYQPNLNDGVQITAAPLWQCFRHGPWQKVLKETWSDLTKGKYDWANLAMSIWPERVALKCANDLSFAIAHGIDDLLWVPDLSSKKKDQLRLLKSPDEELKLLKQAGHSREDLDKAAEDVTAAEKSGLRAHLWIEQPPGTWRRRKSPKEEIENEIARRRGR
jgi:hypothetical protein